MYLWNRTLVAPTDTIWHAIEAIDASGLQIALVVDADRHLLGVVTDGDVRRGILRGFALSDTVAQVMNPSPTVARLDDDRGVVFDLMKRRRHQQIPVVDADGCVIGLEVLGDLLQPERRANPVVVMAGGLGTRLRPLTENVPKPLLKVGPRPILETVVENFLAHGYYRFYFSVNYKAKMIEDYFGDGSAWGAEIEYLYEDQRLGTAGALSLLPERPAQPFMVMNGDLLTKLNFNHLMDFHQVSQAQATMCVREFDLQVPYGVIETDGHRIATVTEKPIQRYLVNAGVYVLNPEVLDLVPDHAFFDMPELFNRLAEGHRETAAFPIREYWRDIGQKDDFIQANDEFHAVFG